MSSQTDHRRLYEPHSNTLDSYSTVYQSFPHGQNFVIYGDADSANIPVQPVETEMTSIQNGEERYEQHNIPSMSEGFRSMYQPTNDTGSIDHTFNSRYSNPSLQSYEEQLRLRSIQKQGTMESYQRQVVLPNSGRMLQQPRESLPNTSLQGEPPESLPNISVENNGSLASRYPSYNHHANQSSSHSHSHKVVFPNRSGMLGAVNQSGYQHQSGQPNVDVGGSQYVSLEQGAKIILPNHSIVLGEANHSIHQNQAGRVNNNSGVNQTASQYYPNKVVLPNHSAVLAERNQNSALDSQYQSKTSLTRSGPVFSADQTALSSQNISLPNNVIEVQPGSVMSQRNRKLDMQNPQNITIPPTMVQEPGSSNSIYKDQKGEVHGEDQYHPNAVAPPPPASVHVSQYQIHPQSQNYAHVESNHIHQHSAGDHKGKKVFILHFTETVGDNPVLKLGLALVRMKVDVTLDLFEIDSPPNSWPLWYEQKIKESNVVLCIITENFYYQLTNSNHVLGYSVYNLMNGSNNITFRAVFIDANKEMEYVPPAMRGATCYSISSNRLTPNDDNFADLYAFLTGQNRIVKPPLGNMITLAPKRSRFGNFAGSSVTPPPAYNNSRNMQQQQQQRMMYQPTAPQQPPPVVGLSGGAPDVEQANFIFVLLGGDATPIKSVRSHNQMLMQLASKLMAEWEALGRMLNVSEPDIYAIKADNMHSVKEQAVQMFQHWMRKNGSRATLGVLTTAVYDSGPQYWNLLDSISKYAPQQ